MKFLLDTNVISELRKGPRCNAAVSAWFSRVADDQIYFSAVTMGEIRRGIESIRRRDEVSAQMLERWYRGLVADHGDRILPIDLRVAEAWGRFNVPDPLPVADALNAAVAAIHGLTLVTRNIKDIGSTGVPALNPFEKTE